ncbi:hypothetical protein H8K38_06985 [Undibacterium sp. FT79W]|uniref:hypothetical protein n=1 Tax=Undibacterium sp. FT79W TaxID=2762296 RepID=UPI00164BF688|nr:hypothetical protein [Undibacterium sp. FT79W]MBC3877545.1 hypothetical protein [Undibacterium sp. FT79W]
MTSAKKVSDAMRKQCLENTQMHTRSNTHHIRTAPYSAHYYRIATPEPDLPPQEKFRQRRKFDRYLYDRKEKKEKLFTFKRCGVGQADDCGDNDGGMRPVPRSFSVAKRKLR